MLSYSTNPLRRSFCVKPPRNPRIRKSLRGRVGSWRLVRIRKMKVPPKFQNFHSPLASVLARTLRIRCYTTRVGLATTRDNVTELFCPSEQITSILNCAQLQPQLPSIGIMSHLDCGTWARCQHRMVIHNSHRINIRRELNDAHAATYSSYSVLPFGMGPAHPGWRVPEQTIGVRLAKVENFRRRMASQAPAWRTTPLQARILSGLGWLAGCLPAWRRGW